MPILNLDIFPHLVMLHVKKKIDLSRKTVQRIMQKLKFNFIFIYLFREKSPKGNFEAEEYPLF